MADMSPEGLKRAPGEDCTCRFVFFSRDQVAKALYRRSRLRLCLRWRTSRASPYSFVNLRLFILSLPDHGVHGGRRIITNINLIIILIVVVSIGFLRGGGGGVVGAIAQIRPCSSSTGQGMQSRVEVWI